MDEVELDYGAITIDNNILKGAGYRFYEGLLNQMLQFSDSPVRVVQTDIVHQEAKKHMATEIGKSRSVIKKALRLAKNHLNINEENVNTAKKILSIASDDNEIAEQRLNVYYERIGAEILLTGRYIDPVRLMRMYFAAEAPFELNEEKKNEFPDAIALISLEHWAEENNLQVIAVSADRGWKEFANNSARITVIDNLAAAISKFQPHNKVKHIIDLIRKSALQGENYILAGLKKAIVDSLEGADIDIEASSYFYYDISNACATYMDHKLLLDDQDLIDVNVVSIKDDIVVLQVSAEVICELTAEFAFSVRDSIDKEYVRMGSATFSTEESYYTDILISLTGDFTDTFFRNLDILEVEVLEIIDSANFGEVEPDYGYEEED